MMGNVKGFARLVVVLLGVSIILGSFEVASVLAVTVSQFSELPGTGVGDANAEEAVAVCSELGDICLVTYNIEQSPGVDSVVLVRRSSDSGQTFGAATDLSAGLTGAGNTPRISCKGEVCIVVWRQPNSRVYASTSTNFGSTWSTAQLIHDAGANGSIGRPDVSCYAQECDVAFAVSLTTSTATTMRIHSSTLANPGSFSRVMTESGTQFNNGVGNPATRVKTNDSGAAVLVLSAGSTVLAMRRSTTGSSFSNLQTIQGLTLSRQTVAAVELVGSLEHVVSIANDAEVFVSRSTNGGVSFSSFTKVATASARVDDVSMSCVSTECYLTWGVAVVDGASVVPQIIVSSNKGATWSQFPTNYGGLVTTPQNGGPNDGKMYEDVDIFCVTGKCIIVLEAEAFNPARRTDIDNASIFFTTISNGVTFQPTNIPTRSPTRNPSRNPTTTPTNSPSTSPTNNPTTPTPTGSPTIFVGRDGDGDESHNIDDDGGNSYLLIILGCTLGGGVLLAGLLRFAGGPRDDDDEDLENKFDATQNGPVVAAPFNPGNLQRPITPSYPPMARPAQSQNRIWSALRSVHFKLILPSSNRHSEISDSSTATQYEPSSSATMRSNYRNRFGMPIRFDTSNLSRIRMSNVPDV